MRTAFRVLAVLFFATAVFHLVQSARIPWGDGGARHALFVAIDAAIGVGVLVRPTGFAALFALLVGQQLASHGGDLVRTWRAERRVDPSDVAVLVVMPATLVALVLDARRKRHASADRPRLDGTR